jgi:uncharacterized protein (TIGR02145 family)
MKNLLIIPMFFACYFGMAQEDFIKIGNQYWSPKNLDTEYYRNGDPIPQVTDPTKWATLTTGAWCYYANDPNNGKSYGKLYNLYAVKDPRGLAPKGWHIPRDDEWEILAKTLGGKDLAASKLKKVIVWGLSKDATDESGFAGLPGGIRKGEPRGSYPDGGIFQQLNDYGYWWSYMEGISPVARIYVLGRYSDKLDSYYYDKTYGASIRCIRD